LFDQLVQIDQITIDFRETSFMGFLSGSVLVCPLGWCPLNVSQHGGNGSAIGQMDNINVLHVWVGNPTIDSLQIGLFKATVCQFCFPILFSEGNHHGSVVDSDKVTVTGDALD
jgi:hypothetical protein